MYYSSKNKESGFTLVELLIAMTIGLIILGALSSTFIIQRKTYAIQEQTVEMVQTGRAAMDMMTREIRMAGYGAPTSNLSTWIDWPPSPTPTINANPTIEEGGSDPDIIHIVGCFDSPVTLHQAAAPGDTTLIFEFMECVDKFNKDDPKVFNPKKKLIFIGGLENAIITATDRIAKTLTIDTDPATTGNQGLSKNYGVGAPIYLVKVIGYSIVKENNTLILKRNENTGGGRQPLAENIKDLQISQSGNSIKVALTARTTKSAPGGSNGYRTYTLTSFITPRNFGL